LALKDDGTVVAWGDDGNGQSSVPAGLTDVVQVAGGRRHSLALKDDGTVVAWGDDGDGQSSVPSGLVAYVPD
jgi:alpha-tubulin suppressor-like RCC1 family protein